MKKILIYQHQSSMNHGCEALVYTISEMIKSVCTDANIVVASFYKADDEKFVFPAVNKFIQNTQWLRRFTLPWFIYQIDKRTFKSKKIQEMIMYCRPCYSMAKKSDVCVAIGGDTYCYNKGKEHWPLERKMRKNGQKMMLWGCSIEPKDVPGELAEHLSNFDVITVRDSISYQALIDNHVQSRIYRCADPAFLLPAEKVDLPAEWEDGKMIGLNFSPMVMGDINDKSKPRKAIHELVKYILKTSDDKIVLIPHVRLSFNDDLDELMPIFEKYKATNRIVLINDINLNAKQIKYIISRCKMFVGARTHATIAAYSTFVPALSIGYSVKARGIARDLFGDEKGLTVSIKDAANGSALIDCYSQIYEKRVVIIDRLKQIMPEYTKMALISKDVLNELIKK